MDKLIDVVVGTRPDIIKAASTIHALENSGVRYSVINTGQHWDAFMNDDFFSALDLHEPTNLNISRDSENRVGNIMKELSGFWCSSTYPDVVVVVGDTDSSFAAAYQASKEHIPVAHIESGLRSGDWREPEEVNRVFIDKISDYLFVSEGDALTTLASEGVDQSKTFFTGSTVADAIDYAFECKYEEPRENYGVLTLHRPLNVDNPDVLERILSALIASGVDIIFPIHPRTNSMLDYLGEEFNEEIESSNIYIVPPMGYNDFLTLISNANFVMTDSGGIQEETTILGVPCYTLKSHSAHPETIRNGTNVLIGTDFEKVRGSAKFAISSGASGGIIKKPELWDGKAGLRVVNALLTRDINRYKEKVAYDD